MVAIMIDKLEFFIALAKAQHFGRAAEELGITQPTLSASLRQLEEQLGVMLVRRGSRFQGLTPEGEQVLNWARRIVGDARTMKQEMRAARHGLSGRLRIAAIPTALAMVPALTTPFRERHPGVTFTILSRTSVEILSLLGNFDIDVGITYLDNEPLGPVVSLPLYTERYRLITAIGSPLADRTQVSWAEVAELPLCLLTPDMQNRRIINRNFMEAGAAPEAMIESNSTVVLAATVARGDWVTILPGDMADFLVTGMPLVAIPIEGAAIAHKVGLITEHQEPHTPVLAALMREAAALAS